MSNKILLSIRPEFADKIISGEKVFEYRKSLPAKNVELLVIYSTSPIGKIIAVAEIEDQLSGTPSFIWNKTCKGAGISREYFRNYFSHCRTAYAFRIGRVFRLKELVDIKTLFPNLNAPQSYYYLSDQDYNRIEPYKEPVSIIKSKMMFVGGIHGTGKTHFCKQIFEPAGFVCKSASSIINNEIHVKNKQTKDIKLNQNILIEKLSHEQSRAVRFVLDGHFTLINKNGIVERIPLDIFKRMNLDTLILLSAETSIIMDRLKKRDGIDWNYALINKFRDDELRYANEVSDVLNIPLIQIDENENLSNAYRKIRSFL